MYTIEELIDLVRMELTVNCALPSILPDDAIRRVIESDALPFFYANYQYAVQKAYYYMDASAFNTEEYTKYSYIQLPCEIQNITYIYLMKGKSLFQVGINNPNLSVNLGITNQPYLSSITTTLAELGMYKTVLDNLSDTLNMTNLQTVKYVYNENNNRLNILTGLTDNMVLECYVRIQQESLFTDPLFIKYVNGAAKIQLGRILTRYTMKLPGNATINGEGVLQEGKDDKQEVLDKIKGMSTTSFFFMVKK